MIHTFSVILRSCRLH